MVWYVKTLWRVCAAVAALVAVSARGAAAPPAVSLGKVSSAAALSRDSLADFRVLVRRTFDGLKLHGQPQGKSYVLSTKLLEFTTVETRRSHTITCVVTAVLRDERQGILKAVLKGTARLSESERPTREGQRLAMQTAVRRALSRVDDALK